MATMLFTFVMTSLGFGALVWWVGRRIAEHVQQDPDAARCLVDHVLIPIFGRKPEDADGESESG